MVTEPLNNRLLAAGPVQTPLAMEQSARSGLAPMQNRLLPNEPTPQLPDTATAPPAQVPLPNSVIQSRVLQHLQTTQLDPAEIDKHADQAAYIAAKVAGLARKGNPTREDIIEAVTDAIADKRIDPAGAVKFLVSIPSRDEDLKTWLNNYFRSTIITAVHFAGLKRANDLRKPLARAS